MAMKMTNILRLATSLNKTTYIPFPKRIAYVTERLKMPRKWVPLDKGSKFVYYYDSDNEKKLCVFNIGNGVDMQLISMDKINDIIYNIREDYFLLLERIDYMRGGSEDHGQIPPHSMKGFNYNWIGIEDLEWAKENLEDDHVIRNMLRRLDPGWMDMTKEKWLALSHDERLDPKFK
jgi:hypothetical protein